VKTEIPFESDDPFGKINQEISWQCSPQSS
jgi:hypothetical protein